MPVVEQGRNNYWTWTDERALVPTQCKINSNLPGGFSLLFITKSYMGPMALTFQAHLHNLSRTPIPKQNGQWIHD